MKPVKPARKPRVAPPSRTPDPSLTPKDALLHEVSYLLYHAPFGSRREFAQLLREIYDKYKIDNVGAVLDDRGRTLLHLAAEQYNWSAIEGLFYEFRAPVDAKDNDGNTALHLLFSREMNAESPMHWPASKLVPYQQE